MKRSRFLLAGVGLAVACAALAADRPLDTVIAKRGDATLTLGLFDARILEVPPEHRAGFIDNGERLENTIRQVLLVQQLANEARKEGLDKDPLLAYQLKLAEDRILAYYRMQQLGKADVKGDFDALAREAYLANKAAYKETDTLRARHILIRTGIREDAAASAIAQEVHHKATSGTAFAELAKTYSDDPSTKDQGGDLPPIDMGKTEPAFEEAVFALTEPGQVSPVVKTRHGYHIIQLAERKPGRQKSFEEVKAQIAAKLREEQAAKLQRAHSDRLQSLPITDFEPEMLGELRTRFGEGPNAQTAAQLPPPALERPKD